jgi:hypothetical protein
VKRTDGKCFAVQENLNGGDHVVTEKRCLGRCEEKRFRDPMFRIRGDKRFVHPPPPSYGKGN